MATPAAELFPHDPLGYGTVYEPDVYRSYDGSDAELFTEFADPAIRPIRGHFTDFLGRITNCRFLPSIGHLSGKASTVIPIPGDGFYADAIEYTGLLRAFKTRGRDAFVVAEFGAGWGPWVAAGGVIARRHGVSSIDLIGVEASLGKIELMKQHLLDNGLRPDVPDLETRLGGIRARCVRAAIWSSDGHVEFPVVKAEQEYGGAVVQGEGTADYRGMLFEKESVPALTVDTLFRDNDVVDFLHIDIQGAELTVCRQALSTLQRKVRHLFVATHSRTIEGELVALLRPSGFDIVQEKPCRFSFGEWPGTVEGLTAADGGQLWRNAALG